MSLKTWNTPWINISHALIVAMNLFQGVSILMHHRSVGWIQFFLAGVIIGVNIWMGLSKRKYERVMATFQRRFAEFERRRGMTETEIIQAEEKARRNLEQIAKVVGAHLEAPLYARLTLGKDEFRIVPGQVRRIRSGSDQQTCFQVSAPFPHPEHIASALLLLKNDPTIFDRWVKQDGYYI